MTRDEFREALLQVMERKDHWAWPRFTSGAVAKSKLHVHLEQEYAEAALRHRLPLSHFVSDDDAHPHQ